jgi:uncharacterized repeat protein (TIGR01451 family)/LPXTG-motif cell wall-anchored protein
MLIAPLPALPSQAASAAAPASVPASAPAKTRAAIPGVCSDIAYLVQSVNGKSGLYTLDLSTGTQTLISDTPPGPTIVYSRVNGFVYSISSDGQTLGWYDPATKTNGSKATSGMPDTSGGGMDAAGNSVDGKLMYAVDFTSHTLYTIDIDPGSATFGQRLSTISTTDVGNVADWAINPVDGFLYGVLLDGTLERLNPSNGNIVSLGQKVPASAYGAVYFDDLGNMYAVNNNTGAVYRIDLTASSPSAPLSAAQIGNGVKVGQSNPTGGNDGAGCLRPYDYGDAPDSYGTTKDNSGARAVADHDLTLGSTVSSELDARTPLDGTGDTDDDSLSALPQLTDNSTSYHLTPSITNNTGGPATLAGWVDFNGNGTFDPGERVTAPVAAGATSADLNWTGLSGVKAGPTYLRLRLYKGDVTDPQPTGLFEDAGEVEDYPITVKHEALDIVKQVTPTVSPGTNATYTILIRNTGEVDENGVTVTDDLSDVLDDGTLIGTPTASSGVATVSGTTLTWNGDIPVGGSARIAYVVQAGPAGTGNGTLANTVTGPPISNCAPGSTDPACTTSTPLSAVKIVKKADKTQATPGEKVTYTVTVQNTGKAPITGGTVSDDLSGVLDDATYNNDATDNGAGGSFSYSSPDLSWTGDLAPGATATLTYSVTVNDPDTGDGKLGNVVTSTIPGSNCIAGTTDPDCTTGVGVPQLRIKKTADTTAPLPGQKVTYTVTLTNPSATDYTGAKFTDDLSGDLDDAAYDGDATATGGRVSYAAPALTWAGDVPAGGTVTVTYSITVGNPPTGDKQLGNTVVSDSPGSNCSAGSTDPDCSTDLKVPALTIKKTAVPAEPHAGDTIRYTLKVTDSGAAPYPGASLTDDLSGVLDDATYNNDAAADVGTTAYTAPKLTWTGDLAVGQTATITYSFKVNTPDTGDGTFINGVLAPGSNCAAGSTDPNCQVILPAPQYDYGDAPDSYHTTRAHDGAYHEIVPGLELGSKVDPDTDGQPSADANADTDDDALATPPALHQHQGDLTLHVKVTNTTGKAAKVAGWIDANGNGTFDPNEAATADAPTGTTAVDLTWHGLDKVPGDHTYLRLRILGDSTGSAVPATRSLRAISATSPVGFGGPGEVEDYRIPVQPSHLTITKTSSTTHPRPGDTVRYTVTVANSSGAQYTGATFTDDLTKVLDDAAYDHDASPTLGSTDYREPKLTWTGDLPAGKNATVTYSVTVHNPDRGDRTLTNAITGPDGSSCATSTAPGCTTTAKVPAPGSPAAPAKPAAPAGQLPHTGTSLWVWYVAMGAILALGLGVLTTATVKRRPRR